MNYTKVEGCSTFREAFWRVSSYCYYYYNGKKRTNNKYNENDKEGKGSGRILYKEEKISNS